MSGYSITDFTAKMSGVIHDDAGKLTADDLARFVTQTIQQRYSGDSPLELVSDVHGDGSKFLQIPVTPDGQFGVFEPDFSVIKTIEYPIEQQPPQYITDSDIRLYRTPSGYKILLCADTPSNGDTLRITWTARHDEAGSTIPQRDFFAIVDYACSLALEALAAIYAQTGDSAISADVVNWRTKSAEYTALAKTIRKRYLCHMGVEESSAAGNEVQPAISIGNQYLEMNSGVDRLVHSKYTR